MIGIEAKDQGVTSALNELMRRAGSLGAAGRSISLLFLSQTEKNFESESGPSGKWKELATATRKARAKLGKWPGKMLQMSAGGLAASVTPFSSDTEAGIGTNKVYGAIQHLGGTIERAPFSSTVRLRTDKRGNLLRQESNDKLAIFAKDSHKLAKTVRYTSGGYSIQIPAREYLPVSGSGELQAGMDLQILDIINDHLAGGR
ncbi:MAG TPA: phage virion morphogenesis protein [Rhodocyclaceae bacterium]|nr:phage virion morphogenesis protein [Rhodocyclaceae bacterium]